MTGPDSSVTGITISTSTADDTISINSVDASTFIDSGAGNDAINVTANGVSAADIVTIDSSSSSGSESLSIDTGGTAGTFATGAFGRVNYQAAGQGLIENASSKPSFGDNLTGLGSGNLTVDLNTLFTSPTALSTTISNSAGDLEADIAGVFTHFFAISALASVSVGGTTAGSNLTVDYSSGDPLPSSGLTYDPPAATGAATNILTLQGGSFTAETYNPTGVGAGSITYNGTTTITFSNLSPVDDTVPSPTFIFNAPAAATTVNVNTGPIVSGMQTDQINDGGTGAFELYNFANKTAVTTNVPANGATTTLNIPTAAAGLSSLSVASGGATETVLVQAIPAGVPTNVQTGTGASTTNVGLGGNLGAIDSLVTVSDPTGTTTLSLLDASDTASASGTITSSTVSGLGFGAGGSVAYTGGTTSGVTSLVIDGGTNGGAGVTYNVTSTSANTTINDGPNADTVNVTGMGLASGTTLSLNDPGGDTLNYNAGGLVPTVAAGGPGEVIISLAGFGTTDVTGYATINITDLPPIAIVPGAASTINTIEGFQDVDANVGTFSLPTATLLPGATGPAASAFTASIDWADPSPDPAAGTITQDASNPSIYYITGTHTFPASGTFHPTTTVNFAGGTISGTVSGTLVTMTLPPSGPTAGTAATANVSQGTLAVSAFPIVGTEGVAIPSAPIATFIDAGGAQPVADYSASISIVNAAGTTVVGPIAATSITQIGNTAQYTVTAPAFTLPEEGTYQVTVAVTDSGSPPTITVDGTSLAVIADAALAASAAVALTPNTGVALSSIKVGSFTDSNTSATVGDFKAVIDWGDGSPTSLGTIVSTGGGGFNVEGTHIYAKPGAYATQIDVTDVGGSAVTITGTATVTDLAVTGSTGDFTAVEGQNTGTFVLATFTDPNTLATVADVKRSLPWAAGATVCRPQRASTSLFSRSASRRSPAQPIRAHRFSRFWAVTPTPRKHPRSRPTRSASSSRPWAE